MRKWWVEMIVRQAQHYQGVAVLSKLQWDFGIWSLKPAFLRRLVAVAQDQDSPLRVESQIQPLPIALNLPVSTLISVVPRCPRWYLAGNLCSEKKENSKRSLTGFPSEIVL